MYASESKSTTFDFVNAKLGLSSRTGTNCELHYLFPASVPKWISVVLAGWVGGKKNNVGVSKG